VERISLFKEFTFLTQKKGYERSESKSMQV